ncbi:hypothetical protein RIU14_00215 [Riemerella anatipestifer]|uniref:hypothetical protein n=1 Tax=Riemerella anatipestifer TaxID=34085 RepID=UPI00285D68DD|nr:hypothetical protein [Riemerella anatipestifer]MDR7693200.1 hypothetical protein [Riemerella anatipestifer]
MKRLLLLTALFSLSMAFSQIRKVDTNQCELIGKHDNFGTTFESIEKCGDIYVFYYLDAKFKHVDSRKHFSFKDEDGAFEYLYSEIKRGLKEQPKEDIMLELPDDYIFLKFTKSFGIRSVQIGHSIKGVNVQGISGWITEKQVDKLFGKSSN